MTHAFSWAEWGRLGAVDLAGHLQRRDVTAADVAAQARAAALAVEPHLGAIVELFDTPPWHPT